MAFPVLLTASAVQDLEEIFDFIRTMDGPGKAEHVLHRIEKTLESLTGNPRRGTYPRELLDLGIREYREVFFKPYRIIYRVLDKRVYVMLIADGRRDMQSLLQRRLLES